MALSFTTLAVTGLTQKFADAPASVSIVNLLGGIESARTIHHTAAVVMMLAAAWHVLAAGYHIFVLRSRMSMLPTLRDAADAWKVFRHNLGLDKSYPQMGRYTFEEKVEYWAFVWGALIMGLTGFLMWNPITATRFLPGEFVPAAKAAHGAEALLAVLAIIIWHLYSVHIRRFNKAMWTGALTEAEMLHEHPLELADLKAGVAERRPDARTLRRRQHIYYPLAAVLSAGMLAAIYGFVNTEQRALTTLPPQAQIEVFVPQTPTPKPTATRAPTIATATASPAPQGTTSPPFTWEGAVSGILQPTCNACHSGASLMGGLDLSTYSGILSGGSSGPAIIPGDSVNSLLIIKQEAGVHPGQLTPEQLLQIRAWIDAGAPER